MFHCNVHGHAKQGGKGCAYIIVITYVVLSRHGKNLHNNIHVPILLKINEHCPVYGTGVLTRGSAGHSGQQDLHW